MSEASLLTRSSRVRRGVQKVRTGQGTQSPTLPLTLFEINKNTNAVVLEMETNTLGGIRRLCDIARPAIGIITNIGDTHLEHLKTRRNVYKEKAELIESLPHNGFAVLNCDDPYAARMKGLRNSKIISYGIHSKTDFTASNIISSTHLRTVSGLQNHFLEFTLNMKYTIRLNTLFYKNIYNALAAIAISHSFFGLNMKAMNGRLRDFRFPPMRMEMLMSDEIGIINDSYNSNPQSVREALLTLKKLRIYGRRIAVLGDMFRVRRKFFSFSFPDWQVMCKVENRYISNRGKFSLFHCERG